MRMWAFCCLVVYGDIAESMHIGYYFGYFLKSTHDGFRAMLIKAAKTSVEGRQVANKGTSLAKLAAQLFALELAEEVEFERLETAGSSVCDVQTPTPEQSLDSLHSVRR